MLTRAPARFATPVAPPLSRAPAARVLVDLSHAADGYVGVAQDLRLIFGMLASLPGVEVSGLLMPTARHDLPIVAPGQPDEAALAAAVLHWMERNWSRPQTRPFPLSVLQSAQVLRQVFRSRHQLLRLPEGSQLNALWRILFARTLPPEQRENVLAQPYYATDLSVSSIIDRTAHLPIPMPKRLDAQGFDAVLFCMPRPVRLPRGVRQIQRFHDAVPVTDVDTVVNWKMAMAHSRLVRACAPDAIFVCNSPQSRDDLLTLDLKREKHAVVIPCALAAARPPVEGADPATVIGRHLTFRALGQTGEAPPAAWTPPTQDLRYVMAVSTLEPRKNFASLVQAWERVVGRRDPDLRLVLVGGPGWREEQVLSQLRPGVERGQIFHLQNVPTHDMQTLMRHAACFASVSYNEGFGYSPLEATQAGAPCLISNLPVFRWIFGDAAIYVDPYDVDSIAIGIERLTSLPNSPDLVRQLRARAEPVLARFRPGAIAEAWDALLQNLREA
ncbi:MAG TPA: glycosyltransferase family 1 protein [Acetobacteraceae bacterium]|nr:glycosyltransferase family 1 protein [Acetobacteraceae bacterium]